MFALASAVKQLFSRKRPAEDELIDNPSQRARTTMAPSDEASVANEEAPEVEAAVTVASAVESGSDAERESAEQEDDEDEDEDEARDLGIAPSSLPTLSQAYASNDLTPSEQQLSAHDARLNDIVSIFRGDITQLATDAIVNAANKSLLGGGGVDGAIHRAAGPGLYDECVGLHGAATGESKITGAHLLPCRHVIHTVGPVYSASKRHECERLLRSCYTSALQLAVDNDCRSIAFSGISTGVYGYPINAATRVALDVVRSFLISPEGAHITNVIFTVFRQIDVDSYTSIVPEFFPPSPESSLEVNVDSAEISGELEVTEDDSVRAELGSGEANED